MTDFPLLILAVTLFASVLANKLAEGTGIPALVLFLALGMFAGSDGLGGIEFADAALAQLLGIAALALILFSGGLDTSWRDVRPILRPGLALATFGVVSTAAIFGVFAHVALGLPPLEALLLGAVVSSTDAAAVFAVLRSKQVRLRGPLKPLLELESGSNDPMAAFLTIGLIELLAAPDRSPVALLLVFALQMPLGALIGAATARLGVVLIARLHLAYDGLYPVLTVSLVLLTYSVADAVGGNGFLAVYLAGIVMGNSRFPRKGELLAFHDAMAWLAQIAMFLTLGLLVFPSALLPVLVPGAIGAAWLMLVARPLSVMVWLSPTRLDVRERVFVSWVGLRGAVPIVLATFPLLAGVQHAAFMFNIVFFVVLASVLIQGTSIPLVARWLRVEAHPQAAG